MPTSQPHVFLPRPTLNRRDFLRHAGRVAGASAAIASIGPLLTACAGSAEESLAGETLGDLALQLAWLPNANSAGEYVALAKGWYADAGLRVELQPGGPELNPIALVAGGTVPVAINYQTPLVLARSRGVPVRAFAAAMQKAPLTYFSFERNGVRSVEDFAGKTIGIQPDGDPFLRALLRNHGLDLEDVKLERAGTSTSALAEGQVDIIAAWIINRGQLAPILDEPDLVYFTLYDHGLRQQSNIYFAQDDTVEREATMLAELLSASSQGWDYALSNPQEAIATVVELSGAELDLAGEEEALAFSEEFVFTPFTKEHGWGALDVEVWEESIDTYDEFDMLEGPVAVDDVLTLDVLDTASDRVRRG